MRTLQKYSLHDNLYYVYRSTLYIKSLAILKFLLHFSRITFYTSRPLKMNLTLFRINTLCSINERYHFDLKLNKFKQFVERYGYYFNLL